MEKFLKYINAQNKEQLKAELKELYASFELVRNYYAIKLEKGVVDEKLLSKIVQSINKRNKFQVDGNEVQDILISIYGDIFDLPAEVLQFQIKDERDAFALQFYATGTAYEASKGMAKNGALRTELTSGLVGKFIRGVDIEINTDIPILSKITITEEVQKEIEILKTFTFQSQILSPRLKIAELRGKEIITKIFKTLKKENNFQLLPKDYQEIYTRVTADQNDRIICDYIAGMTNKYAIEFYGRLTSENPETIFKPL